jgi:hypothetical protein
LLSVPGSKLSFGSAGSGAAGNSSINMTGCNVWYHYYDTTPENLADCKEITDIIKYPNQVGLAGRFF